MLPETTESLQNITFEDSDIFLILRNKFSSNHKMPTAHLHNHYEIYYSLSGEKTYFIKDKVYRVTKGDLVFINEYELHRTTSVNHHLDRERILIYFRRGLFGTQPDLLQDAFSPFQNGSPVLSLNIQEQKIAEELLYKIITEFQNQGRGFMSCIQGLLLELMVMAVRCNEKRLNQPTDHANTLHRKIFDIVQFINRSYAETLTLDTLSAHFHISPYYLSRLFKTTTGFTFVEYVTNVRVKEAQKLLRDTDNKMSLISEEVGFNNLAYFYKAFKKLSHCSPLQYRKHNQL